MKLEHFGMAEPGDCRVVFSATAAELEEAVQAAQESEFLRTVLPEELSHRYYEEELKRCAALKNAADPAEYERIHYFNAI